MGKLINRVKISKFKKIAEGLLYAMISLLALGLCVSNLGAEGPPHLMAAGTFLVAMISMFLGLAVMLHTDARCECGEKIANVKETRLHT